MPARLEQTREQGLGSPPQGSLNSEKKESSHLELCIQELSFSVGLNICSPLLQEETSLVVAEQDTDLCV